MEAITHFLYNLFYFLIVLSVLIFFHEFGHFLAARRLGIKVLKFSLGFGPRIFGRTVGETEYLISALPLGGYVKLFGEEPEKGEDAPVLSPEDRARSFSHAPVWKRIMIVVAGPVFNMLLAYLIFTGSLLVGVSMYVPDFESIMPVIENVIEGSPAASADLRPGDRVLSIDGQKTSTRAQLYEIIYKNPGKALTMVVDRGGQNLTVTVTPVKTVETQGGRHVEGGEIGIESPIPVIDSVVKNSPAEKAGLRPGDRIVMVDEQKILTWQQMTEIIYGSAGKALTIVVERDHQNIPLTVTPAPKTVEGEDGKNIEVGQIGVGRGSRGVQIEAANPLEAVYKGGQATWQWTYLTVEGLIRLAQGKLSKDNIGGPILIGQMSGQAASQGFGSLAFLIAILSITLGVMNILPIPVLDGGHLLFFVIEAVIGRPLSIRKREIAQQVGLALLLLLMALAFYNDIVIRLFGRQG